MSDVKANVREMADTLKAGIALNDAGQPALAADAYESTLPEGMTLDARKAWEKHDNTFMCASALAFGEFSAEHMAKNKDVDQTNTRVVMGADKLDLGFKRSAEVSDGKGGRTEIQGMVSVKYRATAHLTSVKASLRATAAELLAK
jgi:hypothetical protein